MAKPVLRLSLAQGVSLCSVGVLAGLSFLVVALRVRSLPVEVLSLLLAWFCLWFFSHDLAHYLVGRILGVHFQYYYLGRSDVTKLRLPIISEVSRRIPVLGLKIDRSTLRFVAQNKVRAMYAAGALSSMILPWLVLPTAYSIGVLPGFLFTLISSANVLFTLYFSPRVGDLRRARLVQSIFQ